MREIRNNYLGHPEIVPDIKVSGLKDLDILIEFSEKIQAVELKEQFQREKDKEIVRLSNEIKSKVDYAEPIESREHDAEVLSVSAAETIHLIEKYLIHSCPVKGIIMPHPPQGLGKKVGKPCEKKKFLNKFPVAIF